MLRTMWDIRQDIRKGKTKCQTSSVTFCCSCENKWNYLKTNDRLSLMLIFVVQMISTVQESGWLLDIGVVIDVYVGEGGPNPTGEE